MSTPRPFIVYTRTRGVHICEAYNRRHALAWTVALMAREFADFDPREVTSWAVTERQTNDNIFDNQTNNNANNTTTGVNP